MMTSRTQIQSSGLLSVPKRVYMRQSHSALPTTVIKSLMAKVLVLEY